MIIWLASYPKSGNTWVRSIISSILFSKNGKVKNFDILKNIDQYPTQKYFRNFVNDYNDALQIQQSWIPSQELINKDKKIRFFKTHHLFCKYGENSFTNNTNTLGVIHIVRDPRNLVSSIKNHWSLANDNEAVDKLFDIQNATSLKIDNNNEYSFPVMISSWKNHYNAWNKFKKNYLLIKYEDLIENPESQLLTIISYLKKFFKFQINDDKIKNILETTSFSNFKDLENKGFFQEANVDKTGKIKKFFNEGPNKKWQNSLEKSLSNKIEENFLIEMKELGYLE